MAVYGFDDVKNKQNLQGPINIKTLWTGSAVPGQIITIQNADQYGMFIVRTANGPQMFVAKQSTGALASGSFYTLDNVQNGHAIILSVNSTGLTIVRSTWMQHNPSTGHSAINLVSPVVEVCTLWVGEV